MPRHRDSRARVFRTVDVRGCVWMPMRIGKLLSRAAFPLCHLPPPAACLAYLPGRSTACAASQRLCLHLLYWARTGGSRTAHEDSMARESWVWGLEP
jgi:hypothetical protein